MSQKYVNFMPTFKKSILITLSNTIQLDVMMDIVQHILNWRHKYNDVHLTLHSLQTHELFSIMFWHNIINPTKATKRKKKRFHFWFGVPPNLTLKMEFCWRGSLCKIVQNQYYLLILICHTGSSFCYVGLIRIFFFSLLPMYFQAVTAHFLPC